MRWLRRFRREYMVSFKIWGVHGGIVSYHRTEAAAQKRAAKLQATARREYQFVVNRRGER